MRLSSFYARPIQRTRRRLLPRPRLLAQRARRAQRSNERRSSAVRSFPSLLPSSSPRLTSETFSCTFLDEYSILEIGALSPSNYAAHSSWIANTPLDLHSQHPLILEQDFLQRPVPEEGEQLFDVVSCSLVLNFVPVAEDRGTRLSRASFLY
jgi:hypothetical protein